MKRLFVILIAISLLLSCGCASREIDRGYLVSAVGFCRKNGNVKIYIEALSCSDTTDKPSERVVLTAGGVSPQNAFENLKSSLVKPLYFEQLGTVIFENNIDYEFISFLKDTTDINYGVYIVKTNNIDRLFGHDTPNGLLGYDVIGLLKTSGQHKSQLYKINRSSFKLPTINFLGESLCIDAKE